MRQTQNVPQSPPAMVKETRPPHDLDVTNHRLEVGCIRSNKGDIILLYATEVTTGKVTTIRWNEASTRLKAAARRWAFDPLGLLARIEGVGVYTDHIPPPAAPTAGLSSHGAPPSGDATPRAA